MLRVLIVDDEHLARQAMRRLLAAHPVEIVGEAAGHVSRPFCEAHPEIPWSEVTGMRHRIVHDYFAVDYQRLWDTVRGDLPPLIAQLEDLLAEIDEG